VIRVCGEAGAVPEIVIVAESPEAMAPRSHESVVVPEQDPCEGVTEPTARFEGSTSVTTTSPSTFGPWFATFSL
jgi:hypothetical protein